MVNGDKSISLCFISFNDSELAERMVQSVRRIIDEIVVVDQGSDENHSRKLKELADTYHKTTNKGNADYDRQFCYSMATKDYILAMDPDEYFTEEELNKFVEFLSQWNFELSWFLFKNTISCNGVSINLQDILGDDPHPRFWKRTIKLNQREVTPVIWLPQAHKFPNIVTAKQVFLNIRINHDRELSNVIETHLRRGKNIDSEAQATEKNFIRAILNKFEIKVRNEMSSKFPELSEYLK